MVDPVDKTKQFSAGMRTFKSQARLSLDTVTTAWISA